MQRLVADVCVYMLDINTSPTSDYVSAIVAVDCSHMTASSFAPWRRFNSVHVHILLMDMC